MRVVQSMIANDMLNNLSQSYQYIQKVGDELSSGKQLNEPSDNPAGVANAIDLRSTIDANTQYQSSSQSAQNWMEATSAALQQLSGVASRARALAVQAANDTNDATNRNEIASEMQQLLQQVVQVGNSTYAGSYIFAGTMVQTQPFNAAGGYHGNTGAINHTIAPGYVMQANINPNAVFTGQNGIYNTLNQLVTHLNATGNPVAPQNAGTETMALTGTNTGGAGVNYLVKVTGVAANAISTIQYSNDGGATWSANVSPAGVPPSFALSNGISATFANGAVYPQVGDQFSFTTTANTNSTTYTATGGPNVGDETATLSGSYTGAGTPQFLFKPATLDANNNVIGIQYSADNGTTWSTLSATNYSGTDLTYPTATTFDLGSGLTLTWNQSSVNASRVVAAGDTLSFTQPSVAISDDLASLDQVVDSLSAQQAQMGAQQNSVQSNITQLQSQATTLTKALSLVEDADVATLATNMAQAQNLYQAALQVDAKSIEPSLVDFLK
jgi:flagellar hook-associated protein 3 FlgL